MSADLPITRSEQAKLATFSWTEDDGFKICLVTSAEEIHIKLTVTQVAFLAERATSFLASECRKQS